MFFSTLFYSHYIYKISHRFRYLSNSIHGLISMMANLFSSFSCCAAAPSGSATTVYICMCATLTLTQRARPGQPNRDVCIFDIHQHRTESFARPRSIGNGNPIHTKQSATYAPRLDIGAQLAQGASIEYDHTQHGLRRARHQPLERGSVPLLGLVRERRILHFGRRGQGGIWSCII